FALTLCLRHRNPPSVLYIKIRFLIALRHSSFQTPLSSHRSSNTPPPKMFILILFAVLLNLLPLTHAIHFIDPPTNLVQLPNPRLGSPKLKPYTSPTLSDPNAITAMIITSFGAYISNWTDSPYSNASNTDMISFHVHDPRPEYPADVHCVLPTTRNISAMRTDRYITCGDAFPEPDLYIVGIAEGPTYWNDQATAGACPNKTYMPAGTFYHRTTDWEVPIHTIMAGA
ncbi:hypothetical protein GQ43DRAFT_492819, partial [Delitschia confertaspora ATCC 74209]